MIDGDLWDRMQRVAQYAAAHGFGRATAPHVTLQDRYDVALDAITVHVAANGRLADDDIKPWLAVAGRALHHLERDAPLHLRNQAYWIPPGAQDALAEQVADEVGVHQLLGGLTVMERAVVRALADAYLTGGGNAEAAAALGMPYANFNQRLTAARKRAAALWVAPGDTPFRRYLTTRAGKRTKAARWRLNTAYWQRRARRDEPA
jgi:hypothetical protein